MLKNVAHKKIVKKKEAALKTEAAGRGRETSFFFLLGLKFDVLQDIGHQFQL